MGYKVAAIEEIKRKLNELPEIDDRERQISKQEAIRLLASDVAALQARGYGMDQIAAILSEHGVAITVQTLKSYLTRARAPTKNLAKKSQGKRPDSGGSKQSKESVTAATASTPKPITAPKGDETQTNARNSRFTPRSDSQEL